MNFRTVRRSVDTHLSADRANRQPLSVQLTDFFITGQSAIAAMLTVSFMTGDWMFDSGRYGGGRYRGFLWRRVRILHFRRFDSLPRDLAQYRVLADERRRSRASP